MEAGDAEVFCPSLFGCIAGFVFHFSNELGIFPGLPEKTFALMGNGRRNEWVMYAPLTGVFLIA